MDIIGIDWGVQPAWDCSWDQVMEHNHGNHP